MNKETIGLLSSDLDDLEEKMNQLTVRIEALDSYW